MSLGGASTTAGPSVTDALRRGRSSPTARERRRGSVAYGGGGGGNGGGDPPAVIARGCRTYFAYVKSFRIESSTGFEQFESDLSESSAAPNTYRLTSS